MPTPDNREDEFLDAPGERMRKAPIPDPARRPEYPGDFEQGYRTLVDSMDVAFCLIEMLFDERGEPNDYRFLTANPAFEKHTGLSDVIGKTVRQLVPDHDTVWFKVYGDVALTGEPARYESSVVPLNRFFEVYAQRVGGPEDHRVGVFFTDTTARKNAEAALQQSEERFREQGEYLSRLLESSPDCIKTLDLGGRVLTMTEGGQQIMEIDDFSNICGVAWLTFWQDPETKNEVAAAIDTAKAGGTGRLQGFCPTFKGTPRWWDVVVTPIMDAMGKPEQLLAISRDITDQKLVEQRERARLTDIFTRAPAFMAALRGPQHVFELANPPYYQLVGHRDILGKPVGEAIPEVVEQGFVDLLDQVYQTGEPFVGQDIPIMLQVTPEGPLEERFLDFTYQPLYDEDGSVSGILAHGVDLTVRKQLQQERERLLDEQRARAEREALLNRIGGALRSSLEPEAILLAAVTALGEGLAADRCYFVRYDMVRDVARIAPEWRREAAGIGPIGGHDLQMSSFSVNLDFAYRDGNTQKVNDVVDFDPEHAAALVALDIRSLLRVPIEGGNQMTAIAVAMSHAPRNWTDDDVRLVETVATLLHSALESALAQQREHKIAHDLQAALQPAPPTTMPGLALASFYRPALQESSVGGDFFDVYSVEENCTALVVADLSGKGLQAAAQVSTVRNMLRFALYNKQTLSDAINVLHRILVENDLLTGFATLFVGLHDNKESTLTYVNCGQEDALVWRASGGVVQQLPPTGPVLGGFISGEHTVGKIDLLPGDIFFAGTDGMTEVGPSRKQFLEIAGLAELFRRCAVEACAESRQSNGMDAAKLIADSVVAKLIAGVEQYAGSAAGLRDDIALLVGVVTG